MNRIALLLIFLSFWGCEQKKAHPKPMSQTISGRDRGGESGLVRYPLYRVKTFPNWKRLDPSPLTSNLDTRQPIVEFWIDGQIHVTIHNFPSDSMDTRIPPRAQVERWKKQMLTDDNDDFVERPVSFAGFAGFFFEGEDKDKMTIAYALKLDDRHYQSLRSHRQPHNEAFLKQMGSDVTIKAVGPIQAMMKYREDLIAFSESFELIQEIPEP